MISLSAWARTSSSGREIRLAYLCEYRMKGEVGDASLGIAASMYSSANFASEASSLRANQDWRQLRRHRP